MQKIEIINGTYKKDNPHKDIGKQKFRVRKAYTAWVEYDVVANNKEEAEDAVLEHGGIEKIEWQEGYHKDEPVEVYANDWNTDYSQEIYKTEKVAECVPYEEWDSDTDTNYLNYEDPEWTSDEYRWTEEEKQESDKRVAESEIPF